MKKVISTAVALFAGVGLVSVFVLLFSSGAPTIIEGNALLKLKSFSKIIIIKEPSIVGKSSYLALIEGDFLNPNQEPRPEQELHLKLTRAEFLSAIRNHGFEKSLQQVKGWIDAETVYLVTTQSREGGWTYIDSQGTRAIVIMGSEMEIKSN